MYVNDRNFVQLIDNTKRISFLILNGNLGNHFYIICAALYLKQHNFEPIIIIPPLSYNKFINNELPYLNEFKCVVLSHCITLHSRAITDKFHVRNIINIITRKINF